LAFYRSEVIMNGEFVSESQPTTAFLDCDAVFEVTSGAVEQSGPAISIKCE